MPETKKIIDTNSENVVRLKVTEELKNIENKINSMLRDFNIKHIKDASYEIKLSSTRKFVRKNWVKLTPTFRVMFSCLRDDV